MQRAQRPRGVLERVSGTRRQQLLEQGALAARVCRLAQGRTQLHQRTAALHHELCLSRREVGWQSVGTGVMMRRLRAGNR